ncbi:MAG: hypothetical protein NWE78_08345 [Candidatus Bathyarchaeota archaeon]|nr:hypothetical protein [Candidatus Bathyarchaeota archaeon]
MKPPNVTLDNMCIIDLEKQREDAPQIKKLIQMHHDKEINLQVVAASASELKQDRKTHPHHFDEFKKRLASASLSEVKILPTLAYTDISFLDYCVVGGGWLSQLDREIHAILFSEDEVDYSDFCRKYGYDKETREKWNDWVRKKCDVLTLWSHIWFNGDIFVTRDNNFFDSTKMPKLIALGAGKIRKPTETVKMLDC